MQKSLAFLCAFFCLCLSCAFAQTGAWQQLPGPYGGPVNCCTQSGNTWYIGTGNGVYTSTDEGENWTRLNWIPPNQKVTGIYLNDAEIVVATTIVDLSAYFLDEWLTLVYRSTDQGLSWNIDTLNYDFSYGVNNAKVFRHRNALFLLDYYQMMRSDDNGQTWIDLLDINLNVQYMAHNDSLLLIDDGFGSTQYSRDGGDTWQLVGNLPGVFGTVALGVGNTILYVDSFDPSYRTTNFGASWQSIGTPFGYSDISTFKTLPGGKLVGFVSYPDNDEMIFVSGDNGSTWKKFRGSPLSMATDVVVSGTVYGVATPMGFYKNYSTGNFLNPSNTGILASDVRTLLNHNDQLLAGASDALWRSFDHGANWFPGFPQSQLTDIREVLAKGDTLCLINSGYFLYSTDQGDSWVNPYVSGGSPWSTPFSEAVHLVVHDNTVLIGGEDLYASNDFGANWTSTNDFLRGSGVTYANGYYFGMGYWDGILRSDDDCQSWDNVYSSILGSGRLYVLQDRLFACLEDGLLRGNATGNVWSTVFGLPTHGTFNNGYSVGAMATDNTTLYAGVDYKGIYTSTDNGQHWLPLDTTLIDAKFNDLQIIDKALYAAIAGGGIWKLPLTNVSTHTPESAQRLVLWPNPLGEQALNIALPPNTSGKGKISVFNANGQCLFTRWVETAMPDISLPLNHLPKGVYRVSFTSDKTSWSGSFVK